MEKAGVKKIREISRMQSFEEYLLMAEANFNLVLNSEARYAAQDMSKNLEIPFIELNNLHRADKIHAQYMALAQALNVKFDDTLFYEKTLENIKDFKSKYALFYFVTQLPEARQFR